MATVMAPALQQEIDEVNRAFEHTFNAGDPAAAARGVYSLDARVLPPGGEPVQGREAIAQFWAGAAAEMGIQSVHLATVEVQQLGEGAWEVGRATLGLVGGVQAQVKYVVVWTRENSAWKWHIDIWNANP